MSRHPEIPTSEELREYYENIPANWPIDAVRILPGLCIDPNPS
jgi:hypothetical protein